MSKSPHTNVFLSLMGLFKKHKIKYKLKKTTYSYYFNVIIDDNDLLIRVSDHDQPIDILASRRKPDFDLRTKKCYTATKKELKGLKYNEKSKC